MGVSRFTPIASAECRSFNMRWLVCAGSFIAFWHKREQISSRVFPCGALAPISPSEHFDGSTRRPKDVLERPMISACCRKHACHCCVPIRLYHAGIQQAGLFIAEQSDRNVRNVAAWRVDLCHRIILTLHYGSGRSEQNWTVFRPLRWHNAAMGKTNDQQALAIPCPTCGSKAGEKCELSSGQPRKTPHRDRRLAAKDSERLMFQPATVPDRHGSGLKPI